MNGKGKGEMLSALSAGPLPYRGKAVIPLEDPAVNNASHASAPLGLDVGSASESVFNPGLATQGRPFTMTRERALTKIALLGEALADIFPDREVIGGAPFNVARNLAALGESPLMVTRLGQDALGARIQAECRRFGLGPRGLQHDPARPTGTVAVHMQGAHHAFVIGPDQAWDHLDTDAAVQAVAAAQPQVVYFGTLAQRAAPSRQAIRQALAATPAVRFLDLNLREGPDNRVLSAESLALANLVKVNDDELDHLLSWFVHPGEAPAAWGTARHHLAVERLMRSFELQRVVVTRGAQGWACFDGPHSEVLEGRAPQVTVRDTVGAGDAFASVLLLGELYRWSLAETLPRAAGFASAVCTLQGAVDADSGIYKQAARDWHLSSAL
jgi:fructokinase